MPASAPVRRPEAADLSGGVAVYDERQATKQPDWTYS